MRPTKLIPQKFSGTQLKPLLNTANDPTANDPKRNVSLQNERAARRWALRLNNFARDSGSKLNQQTTLNGHAFFNQHFAEAFLDSLF